MTKLTHGTIRGKTIELADDLGLADGQEVEVQVIVTLPERKWGDSIVRTAGALANDPHWDGIMEEVRQARRVDCVGV